MEKRKVQCVNKHWFDAGKFEFCPHCGAGISTGEEEPVKEEHGFLENGKEKKKGFFFGRNKEKKEEQEFPLTGGETCKEQVINPIGFTPQVYPKTEVMDSTEILSGSDETAEMSTFAGSTSHNEKIPFPDVVSVKSPIVKRDIDDVKTVSLYANEQGEEPVTGWLVGIQGVYKGSSFSLKTGVNIIGRDTSSYVCLKKDAQVSREKHAVIIYEPKKKVFYLGEGDNSLTYCNEELVCGKEELHSYDVIEIGGGKYFFIPFCGERFDWDKED